MKSNAVGISGLQTGGGVISRARVVRRPAVAWVWLPVVIGGIELIVLLERLKSVLGGIYLNSDSASAPVIGSFLGSGSAPQFVTLGHYPWYEALWFMQITRALPAHRELWEVAPVVLACVAYALTVWSASRLFGRWTAAIVAVLLVSTTPAIRGSLFALNSHGATVVHGCVLAAALVFVNLRAGRLPAGRLAALALVLGVFTAVGEGSDRLLLVYGIFPFLGTGCLLWWRRRGPAQARVAGFAVLTSVVGVLGGEIAATAMRSAHVTPAPHFALQVLPLSQLATSVKIFLHAVAYLGGGDVLGNGALRGGVFGAAGGALMLLGGAAVGVLLLRPLLATLRAAEEPLEPVAVARDAYVLFWGLALAGGVIAFLFSSASVDDQSARYLLNTFVAVAVLLPAVAARTRLARAAVVAGASAFALVGIHGLLGSQTTASPHPTAKGASGLERYLDAHHLKYGYGPYWDAAALTWTWNLTIEVFPVAACEPHGRLTACPYFLHTVSTWYEPRARTRTFLLVDSSLGLGPRPSRAFGRPDAIAHVGRFTVYVYGHDLARDMPAARDWPRRTTVVGAVTSHRA